MSNLINIVGNTKAALTSTRVYTPISNNQSGKLVVLENSDDAIAKSLRDKVSFSLRDGSSTVRRKVVTKLAVPYQPAAVDGVLPPIAIAERIITDLIPESATSVELTQLELLAAQANTDPMYVDLVNNGRFPY